MKRIFCLLGLLSLSGSIWGADDALYGTWVQRTPEPMTLIVEKSGSSTKFTYRMPSGFQPNLDMSFETQFDGKEVHVMVDGKPSDQTMVITRIDDRHIVGVRKVKGSQTGTSKLEMSADGKVLQVDNDNTSAGPNGTAGMTTEYWDRK